MAKYVIKNNLPTCKGTEWFKAEFGDCMGHNSRKNAIFYFNDAISQLREFETKAYLKNGKDLRGTIQVEIDGFYYYVELYKEQ